MKDFEVANIGTSSDLSDIDDRFLDAYQATIDCEESFHNVEMMVMDLDFEECDVCNTLSLVNKYRDILSSISEIPVIAASKITSVLSANGMDMDSSVSPDTPSMSAGLEAYCAVGIIMKRFQILKYKIEKTKLAIERRILEITKSVLVWTLDGKGSTLTAPIQAALATVAALASVVNVIMTALGAALSLLDNIPVTNVGAASAALFMTPKSFVKTDITIANANHSTTNSIPDVINRAITEAEESIKRANGALKKAAIAAAAADGAASASNGEFEYSGIGDFEVFDPNKIRQIVNAIMLTLVDAEVLPRYEKLNITNIRFMTYLATGFEPAAKKSFGIPGFP